MFLLEQSRTDLTLKGLDLGDELRIVFLRAAALVRQVVGHILNLSPQLGEGFQIFAIARSDFVFKVTQLQIHLSPRLKNWCVVRTLLFTARVFLVKVCGRWVG